MHFCVDICTLFSDAGGSFSRSRLRGKQGARLYTTAQVWVPVGSVARALGVQSREVWQVIVGLLSDKLLTPCRGNQAHAKPPRMSFWFFRLLSAVKG